MIARANKGVYDFVQPDASVIGGISAVMEIISAVGAMDIDTVWCMLGAELSPSWRITTPRLPEEEDGLNTHARFSFGRRNDWRSMRYSWRKIVPPDCSGFGNYSFRGHGTPISIR